MSNRSKMYSYRRQCINPRNPKLALCIVCVIHFFEFNVLFTNNYKTKKSKEVDSTKDSF